MKFRAWRALLLMTTAIVSPALAQADPVTLTALVSIAAGSAVTSALTTAGIGAVVAGLLGAALTFAIQFAGQLLFGKNLDTGAQQKGRTRKFDPHPPFRFAFGEFPQDGSVVFHYADEDEYYLVYLLNSIPSDGLSRIEINDGINLSLRSLVDSSVITLSDAGSDIYDMNKGAFSETPPYWDDSKNVQFWVGLGEQTQPPQAWIDDADGYDRIGNKIKTTDVWNGATVVFVKLKFGASKKASVRWTHGRPPPLKFFGKWSKLYDPLLDSTSGVTGASGSHRIDDRTTWAWSANPALCGLMLATHEFALGFDQEMIPIQQWADAAAACDVEDGGVAKTALHSEDWTGLTLVNHSPDSDFDAGSGVWVYGRGGDGIAVFATGTIAELSGVPVVQLKSTDTDGTVIESETGQLAVYIDMQANARRGDSQYIFRQDTIIAGVVGSDKFRRKIYAADDSGDSTESERRASFMPPRAGNVTLIYDQGLQFFPADPPVAEHLITADFISFVFEGGGPNEGHIEIGPVDFFTTSQSALVRYRCDGIVIIEERELSLLDSVLVSMAGHLDTTGGMLGVRAGVWVAPVDALSQPVGDEVEIIGARDAGFDTVRAKFIGRHREWQLTDGPGYALRAGARIHPLQLSMVREPEQAARLEKIFGKRAEPNRIVTAEWDGRESSRRIGERVNFALPGFARAASSYVVDSIQPVLEAAGDGFKVGSRMTLIEDLEANYDWASGDYSEGGDFTLPEQTSPTLTDPTSVVALQVNFDGPSGATARLKISITITQALSERAEELRIETTDGSGYAPLIDLPVVSGTLTYITYLNPAVVGITYTARALAQASELGESAWVTSNSVAIVTAVFDYSRDDYSAEYA